MLRKRNMPALIGTIALIAGCGSQARAEVSGVVRDARTGRAIAGARVYAQDGSATRTDAQGRFTISVSRRLAQEIRASAAGRCDASAQLDVSGDLVVALPTRPLEIELAPCADENVTEPSAWDGDRLHDPDAVLRWIDDLDWSALADHPAIERAGDPSDAIETPVWSASEQWALGAMSLQARPLGDGAARSERRARGACAGCHEASAFAGIHGGVARDACGACHAGPLERRDLRVYEHVDDVAGTAAHGLGSGAVCVECHRTTPDAIAHAPQADVLLGRGVRASIGRAIGEAPHAAIADTCVACHAPSWRDGDPESVTLGHTFRVRDQSGEIARDACSACHGDVDPRSIGRGDWDGDGVEGSIGEEHDRALARARDAVRARMAAARISRCGRSVPPAGSAEREGVLWLVDVRGALLGDCDGNGELDGAERGATIDELDPELRDDVIDLARIERDGSRGAHHAPLAFAVLSALAD